MSVFNYLKRGLRKAGLLPHVKRLLTPLAKLSERHRGAAALLYLIRLVNERLNYAECTNVHDLPAIFHYWTNRYLLPKFEPYGFSNINSFFTLNLEQRFAREDKDCRRFISIGSGNCDSEIVFAKLLMGQGHENFTIECLDINQEMLERGKALAEKEGVAEKVIPLQGDFNTWKPSRQYDAVIANQSLHHVLELEHLFDSIKTALGENGRFIVSDMIGRNGHQRWPEALPIVREFWEELPKAYHFNHLLHCYQKIFRNDETVGLFNFEGIRAQDILPLSVKYFHFEFFAGFANVIDPFIDRTFGYNFDVNKAWDREFIDRVHARDEKEILSGRIKPTHMLAVMSNDHSVKGVFVDGLTPEQCMRKSWRSSNPTLSGSSSQDAAEI